MYSVRAYRTRRFIWRGVYFGDMVIYSIFHAISQSANINVTTSTRDFILLINTA